MNDDRAGKSDPNDRRNRFTWDNGDVTITAPKPEEKGKKAAPPTDQKPGKPS